MAARGTSRRASDMPPLADIAVFGLAVMGRNLALNLADKGFHVVAYERDGDGLDGFLAGPARGTTIVGARLPAEAAALLQRPRCVLLLVKAGDAVDRSIDGLLPYLETGDIIVDGGNSHYTDSERRGTARLSLRAASASSAWASPAAKQVPATARA